MMNHVIQVLKPHSQYISIQCMRFMRCFSVETNMIKKDLYILPMFPYPSGKLHMGHVRVYSISDCLAKYYTLNGHKVLHTIGWDAFGLPAENAARDHGIDPKIWTQNNIKEMRTQLQKLHIDFDWTKEINTSSPEYYKWTQYLFLRLYNSGLVHYKNAPVYYDPVDKTVLADEQVDSEGKSWRSGAVAELKVMKQWYIDISKYAPELYDNINNLKEWPDIITQLQKNWIGTQKGYNIILNYQFNSMNPSIYKKDQKTILSESIFISKLETLLGLEFIALSPMHSLVNTCKELYPDLKTQIESQSLSILSHSYGLKCNTIYSYPLPITFYNPILKRNIPVFITNTVIADYKQHIKLGIPSENEIDKKTADSLKINYMEIYKKEKNDTIMINSNEYNSLSLSLCRQKLYSNLKSLNILEPTTYSRLRDWSIARQRFWGTPLPIIHCPHCGIVPVPYEQLPLKLPEGPAEISYGQENDYLTPLQHYPSWIHCQCPKCNSAASRDGNTLDTFLDSAWYYLRYPDVHNTKEIFSPKMMKPYEGQVDYYIGGTEHSVGHLLYARFIRLFFTKQGILPPKEPFKRIYSPGMVLGPAYVDPLNGEYIHKENIEFKEGNYYNNINNHQLNEVMMKMSKSKFNGIDPLNVIDKYGSDAVRFGILFKCPLSNEFPWKEDVCEIAGKFESRIDRCMNKLYEYQNNNKNSFNHLQRDDHLNDLYVKYVHAIKHNMNNGDIHIAISQLMSLINTLNESQLSSTYVSICKSLPLYLYPYLPEYSKHLYENIYKKLYTKEEQQKFNSNIDNNLWPDLKKNVSYKVIVQINNKKNSIFNLSESEFQNNEKNITDYILKRSEFSKVMEKPIKTTKTIVKNHNIVINIIL